MGNLLNPLVFMPPPKTDISSFPVEYLQTPKATTIPFVFLRGPSPVTLLYSHGNAEDLGGALRFLRGFMSSLGVSICCYEYSGYGYSTGGGPSEAHVYADIETAYKHLVHGHRVAPKNIVIVGRSLGTGPSTYLAAKTPGIRGLVLISALASVYRVTLPMNIKTLPGDAFCSIDRMHRIKAPLLLLHGTSDRLTTAHHAKALADRAKGSVRYCCFLSGATHGSITTTAWRRAIESEFRCFLFECLQRQTTVSSRETSAGNSSVSSATSLSRTKHVLVRHRDKSITSSASRGFYKPADRI